MLQRDLYRRQFANIADVKVHDVYGVSWDKSSNPVLTRTDKAVGMVANAGTGGNIVVNDFDNTPLFGSIREVTDDSGNKFIRIPKLYIKKTDGANLNTWQVSLTKRPGFYLPWCFWDFINNHELPFIDVGKYKASKSGVNKLESKANVFPLVSDNIVNFRTYARNNNAVGLQGYQQLDLHVIDVLRTLMFIEFATLNIQTVMQGYATGQYDATHTATIAENGVNRIIIANAKAAGYVVGQPISLGTSLGGNQIATNRTISSIDVYDANNKAISFDGAPVNIAVGNIVYNSAWKNGFSAGIAASSGSLVANDGKSPCVYRGIESPFGDIWQFIDGLNITDRQAWICKNAAQYASNVFASPYEQIGYVDAVANGYVKAMGFDPNYPFVELPIDVTGGSTTYYSDYYYQDAGQRLALFGGYWNFGSNAGLSDWALHYSSSDAYLAFGGRLCKKAQ
jgi:hypothetical protein